MQSSLSPNSQRATRGLPGFLRRSLRPAVADDVDFDMVESINDTIDDIDINKNKNESTIKEEEEETTTNDKEEVSKTNNNNKEVVEKPSPAYQRSKTMNDIPDKKEERLSTLKREDDDQKKMNDTSAKSLSSSRRTLSATGSTTSVTSTYRDRQFESCLDANIVSITELRKLCWNGIPRWHRAKAWKLLLGYLPLNSSRHKLILQRKRLEYKAAIAQHYDIDDDIRTLQEQETLRQVLVDVPRTAPEVNLFRNDRIRFLMSRLLYIWACRHPASSYVQGINDLATPFIIVFVREHLYKIGVLKYNNVNDIYNLEPDDPNFTEDDSDYCLQHEDDINYDAVSEGNLLHHITDDALQEIEADVYWCLTNLLAGIQDHYTSDQPGVQRMVMKLEELVTRIDSSLSQHLSTMGIMFVQFAFKWMNCLLLREFTLCPCIERLWDTYLSENGSQGSVTATNSISQADNVGTTNSSSSAFQEFHVYVCAAFLCQFSSSLKSMTEFEDIFQFLQSMPTSHWSIVEIEVLVSQAYVLSTLFTGSDAHLANTELIR